MKVVYRLIDNNIQSELVDNEYGLKNNETFEKPVDGIYQPFSFSNGLIIGVTQSEWEQSVTNKQNNQSENSQSGIDNQQLAKLSQIVLEQAATIVQQGLAIKSFQKTNNGSGANNVQSN